MLPIKICGLTRADDAALAWSLGAAALGFIFDPGSPRRITAEEAARIRRALPPEAVTVGVFTDAPAAEIVRTARAARLSAVQLHGRESAGDCSALNVPAIKTLRAGQTEELEAWRAHPAAAFLLDASHPTLAGGTGILADWELARRLAACCRLILAGGLNPENALSAAAQVRPAGLDVNSGVERSPGRKDPDRMRALFDLFPWKGERPCLI